MKDFPLIRSGRTAFIGVLAVALPLLLLSLTPLTGVYAAMLVLLLLPAGLCIAGTTGGLAPMLLGAAAGIFSMFLLAGQQGALLASVYVLPILAVFILLFQFKIPFWKSCAAMIGVHVVALAGVYLLLQQMTGNNLYVAAGDTVMRALENWELGDTMLYQFYATGMITLPQEMEGSAVLESGAMGIILSPEARADLLLSVRSMVQSTLAALIPNLIVTQSILGGVLCLLLSIRFGYIAAERREFLKNPPADTEGETPALRKPDFPTLGMPPLSLWHIPRGMGWQVGAALIAGNFLQLSASAPLAIAGIILYGAATALFTLQGAAMINFTQKTRGVKRHWRIIVPILLMMFSVLSFIGIFDQIVNLRGLRKPREPKEDE